MNILFKYKEGEVYIARPFVGDSFFLVQIVEVQITTKSNEDDAYEAIIKILVDFEGFASKGGVYLEGLFGINQNLTVKQIKLKDYPSDVLTNPEKYFTEYYI